MKLDSRVWENSFAFLIALTLLAAPPAAAFAQSKGQTYNELLAAIREVRSAAQARIEKAVQQERVREAWETGKLIDEHVLQYKERAEYGEQVILRLVWV